MQALPSGYPLSTLSPYRPVSIRSAQSLSPFAQASPFVAQTFSPIPQAKPQKPVDYERIKAGIIAASLLTAAILIARYAPSKATTELIPSDWKVWAKMGLSVAALNQINKAANWQPPAWLGGMMNVLLITPLLSGKNGLHMLPILLPTVGAMVQSTQLISDKAEKTLNDKYGMPPLATRLLISAASMGVGIMAIPRLLGLFHSTWLYPKADLGKAALTTAMITCSRGCCASAVCMNEIADYGAAIIGWLQGHPTRREHP